MSERPEILCRLYEESMEHVRHLEEQRSQFASVLLATAGAVIAFGIPDGNLRAEYYSGLLLCGIGAFGSLLSWKQNEKINFHRRVAIRYRELIANLPGLENDPLEAIRRNEDNENRCRYCGIAVVPVGLFWSLLYVMVLAFGFFILARQT